MFLLVQDMLPRRMDGSMEQWKDRLKEGEAMESVFI